MKVKFSKGKANQRSLEDRMKDYEKVTTDLSLVERIPVYARIDMRAGHTWCKHLNRPFDDDYSNAMQKATSYIVEKTGAVLGYTQSDEASFVWLDSSKVPFETRLFKLQSVLASMFTGAFISACKNTKLESHCNEAIPSFDCRVCNMPDMSEASNMILWRTQDSVKNSITLLALEHFSTKDLDKVNGKEKIKMLSEKCGIDYYTFLPEKYRLGSYFRRELFKKELTSEDLLHIPEENLPEVSEDGKRYVTRSHVVSFTIGMNLSEVQNRTGVLFNKEPPVKKEMQKIENCSLS